MAHSPATCKKSADGIEKYSMLHQHIWCVDTLVDGPNMSRQQGSYLEATTKINGTTPGFGLHDIIDKIVSKMVPDCW